VKKQIQSSGIFGICFRQHCLLLISFGTLKPFFWLSICFSLQSVSFTTPAKEKEKKKKTRMLKLWSVTS
jgi:hypothetical protein